MKNGEETQLQAAQNSTSMSTSAELEKLLQFIRSRRLEAPALLMAHTVRPFRGSAYLAVEAFSPLGARAFGERWATLMTFLREPEQLECLIRALEGENRSEESSS